MSANISFSLFEFRLRQVDEKRSPTVYFEDLQPRRGRRIISRMFFDFLAKIFGSKNERELRKLASVIAKINSLEPEMQVKSDDQLKAQTSLLKNRVEQGESLDDILPDAFATVREASVRTLEMRHFDA